MSIWCGVGLARLLLFPVRRRNITSISASALSSNVNCSSLTAENYSKDVYSANSSSCLSEKCLKDALSVQQKDQISLYITTLLQWNQKMNLTAVRDESEAMLRHVEDSLSVLSPLKRVYSANCSNELSSSNDLNLIDVGSGAGLPGIILAIACPSWKFTLLESMQKRCKFLEHVIKLVGLSNVNIICERAENIGRSVDSRESYDVAVARAVAELRILAEYCLPLVRVGGLFIAAKGSDPKEEIRDAEKAVRLLGGNILESCNVDSIGPFGQRTAIICLKDRATPRKYPRQPGIPSKKPL